MKPKISVIVPVYNTEKYLQRCIDSILLQSFTDFELLLIDDGSTDSSGTICDKYTEQDSRVRVFHKGNGGVSSARNMGLDNAKGEWFTFVDSDDYVHPSFLVNFMDVASGAELIIQALSMRSKSLLNNEIPDSVFDYKGNAQDVIPILIKNYMPGALWNKLFNARIINDNKLRLNESYEFKEDEEFLLRYMSMVKTVTATSRVGYVYLVPDMGKYRTSYNCLY